MKNNYSFHVWQAIRVVLVTLLFVANWSFVFAQACGDPGGGSVDFSLTAPPARDYYPGALPAGKTGQSRATVARIGTKATMNVVYPKAITTLHPELPGGVTGYVTLKFESLIMAAPNAVIKIYEGIDETGTLVKTIDSTNAASFILTSESHVGPVTITFESSAPTSGNFNISILAMTGNQLISSTCQGHKAALWTEFQQPDSYTLIDGHRDYAHGSFTPSCVAYIDANRQFVSSEMVYCLDHSRSAVGFGSGRYPGQTIYTKEIITDIDRSGTFDDTDRLIMARLVYMMAHATTGVTVWDMEFMEGQVWVTVIYPGANYGGVNGDAVTTIPSIPNPAEPTFSLTGPVAPVPPNNPAVFTLQFDLPAGYNPSLFTDPQQVKLVVPAGVTISNVSGDATYAGGVLTFTSLPATVLISAVSTTQQKATLKVVYEKPGLWNVYNFKAYRPCTTSATLLQDFVGRSQGDITYPNREAEGIWESSLPVRLVNFKASAEGRVAYLNWTTASEEGSKGFEIQRSADTRTWQTLDFVNSKSANGNSSVELNYQYNDLSLLTGTSYYRLRMVDLDGAFAYSQTRSLQAEKVRGMLVYPNPVVNGKLSVVVSGMEPEAAEIYDAAGVRKISQKLENGRDLNLKGLAPGAYILRVVSAGKDSQSTTFLVK